MKKNYDVLRNQCQYIWYFGSGNFWHEKGIIKGDTNIAYRCFQFILFTTYFTMTVGEIAAVLYGNFPSDEHGDCVTFSFSHSMVLIKFFSVIRNKELIRRLNAKMVKICEEYEDQVMMTEQYRIIKINVYIYVSNVYGAMLCFIYEGFRKMFAGSHFVTIVTYYPPFEDNSHFATAVRVFTTFVLGVMMLTMISIDTLAMMYLIMFKYKFITLRQYLEGIRRTFDLESVSNLRLASQKLKEGLVKGIQMHGELIWMCKDIDKAFGPVVTLQLCLSCGSVVSLLLSLALATDLTLVAAAKVATFAFALYLLLGLFLCNAGAITYQASLLSDAIFYCGWHMCESKRDVRPIVLLSIKQAQQPLVMKAFKMIELTYATFLQVVRSTYSVFALLYAHNK